MITLAVVGLWLLVAGVDLVADLLNVRAWRPELPAEFRGVYDDAKYRRSREYLRDTTRFGWLRRVVSLGATIAFLWIGGFEWADGLARGWVGERGAIVTGLAFFGLLALLRTLLGLPFSAYGTFVIEDRYGFNRTTPGVFVGDFLKGLVLTLLLGAPALAGVLWFFESTGERAWLWSWFAITAFQLLVLFIAPAVIMPLFNKYDPVPAGELRKSIEDYAATQDFKLQGIYVMDGSKRSSKSNAFFTGFGRYRRLVLFDTLVKNHTVPELTGVLAHEIGTFG